MDPETGQWDDQDESRLPPAPPLDRPVLPVIHKHWIVLARGMALPVIVGLLLLLLLGRAGPAAVLLILLAAGAAITWVWMLWAAATMTVTNQRVIIREGILVKNTKLIPLNRVQNVSTRQNVSGQLLDYGTVEIDTAGRFELELVTYVPAPEWIREQVFALADRLRREQEPGL